MSSTNESQNNTDKEVTFTQKCILMSKIFQDKSKQLLTSFNDFFIVKLYTGRLNENKLIYSKISGVLCLLQERSDNTKYYFQIYSIKNYSLLFSIELKNTDISFFEKLKENFYCLPTSKCYIVFKFLSKENGEIFYNSLKDKPKQDTLIQNENAFNSLNNPDNSVNKDILDYIKDNLKDYIYNNKQSSKNSTINNNQIWINGENGDYIDFSDINLIYNLIKNIQFDKDTNCLYIFTDKNLEEKFCSKIIKNYFDIYNKNSSFDTMKFTFPLKIVDKDFKLISDKNKYIEFLINNIVKTFEEESKLIIFKQKHKKKRNIPKMKKGLTTNNLRKTLSKNIDGSKTARGLKSSNNTFLKMKNAIAELPEEEDDIKNQNMTSRKNSIVRRNTNQKLNEKNNINGSAKKKDYVNKTFNANINRNKDKNFKDNKKNVIYKTNTVKKK